ncbi:MAG TPA: serine hydrolase [Candidatus Paceibacterota bacterium]|nr:serine hydrolase [Candidatus Paceibacterota bacterium]
MNRRIILYSLFLMAIFGLAALVAFVGPHLGIMRGGLTAEVSAPAGLTTDTWGIFDPATGELIAGEHASDARPIASVAKLFTAYAVMASEKRDDLVTISAGDVATEGRAGKLYVGERMTPYKLLFPMLIESSNDAAEAARRTLGVDFTKNVTNIESDLGLKNTTLADGAGLSPKSVSSVEDLSRFYAHLKKTYPHVLDITRLNMYIDDHTGYVNNDPARSLTTFEGGKNGYTDEAARTFVGTFSKDGAEVGIVLLGSTDIVRDIERLLAFRKSPKGGF